MYYGGRFYICNVELELTYILYSFKLITALYYKSIKFIEEGIYLRGHTPKQRFAQMTPQEVQ